MKTTGEDHVFGFVFLESIYGIIDAPIALFAKFCFKLSRTNGDDENSSFIPF